MRKSPSQRRLWKTVSRTPRRAPTSISARAFAGVAANGLSTTVADPASMAADGERDVGAVGRGDDDRRPPVDRVRTAGSALATMRAPGWSLAAAACRSGLASDDRGEPQPGRRGDERRVERQPGKAIADQTDAESLQDIPRIIRHFRGVCHPVEAVAGIYASPTPANGGALQVVCNRQPDSCMSGAGRGNMQPGGCV